MKAKLIAVPLLISATMLFVGCTSTSTTTQTTAQTPEQSSHTIQQTYTQHDLERSGRANAGPALKTIDPDVQ